MDRYYLSKPMVQLILAKNILNSNIYLKECVNMPRESIYKRYSPAISDDNEKKDSGFWFVFCLNKLLIKNNTENFGIPYVANLRELQLFQERTQYLGTLQGQPCYCAEVPSDTIAPEGMSFMELRSLYNVLDEDIFLLAGKAIQIVHWDHTHQYCSCCGVQVSQLPDERAKKCPECGSLSYPRISPAVIVAVLKDNKILLARARNFNSNMYSIIAGFVEPGETLEECIKREVMEEVNLQVKNIKYFGSQHWPFPHSLMIGFTAEYENGEISVDGTEISDAGWFEADALPEIPPKMSISREIIDSFIECNTRIVYP
jgi:NAD+ diphosphatase